MLGRALKGPSLWSPVAGYSVSLPEKGENSFSLQKAAHGSIPVMSLSQIIQAQIPFWAQDTYLPGLGPASQVQAESLQLGWPLPQTLGGSGPGFQDRGIEDQMCLRKLPLTQDVFF